MDKTYWLIEYRENGQTVGYLKDMRRGDGGFDVLMTRDSAQALRFDNPYSPKILIEDWAFQRTVPHADSFFVEGHMDCDGPTHAEIDADASSSTPQKEAS
jgi:hypothetical protein